MIKKVFIVTSLILMAIILTHVSLNNHLKSQQKQLLLLQSNLNTQLLEVAHLSAEKQRMEQLAAQLKFIMDARAKSFRAVNLLNQLITTVPEQVSLIRVARHRDFVMLEGKAHSDLDITTLMADLAGLPGFSQPVLTGISTKQVGGNDRFFQLKVNHL